MTLLTIVQNACDEVGFPRPSSVIGNTETTVRQMLTLTNKVGKSLMRKYDWQELKDEAMFDAVASDQQVTIKTQWTDFDRFVPDSMHNRTQQRKVWGPLSTQAWQWNKSEVAQTQYDTFYVREGNIYFTPDGTAGDDIYFEYISEDWCEDSLGTNKSSMTADTDVARIDEYLLELGLVWRFKRSHGYDYAEEFREFQRECQIKFGQHGPRPRINIAGWRRFDLTDSNVPDGSWS